MRWLVLVVLASGTAMASPTHGYDQIRRVEFAHGAAPFTQTRTSSGTPLRWPGSCVFLRPSIAGAADVADFAAALTAATAAWDAATRSCGYLRFQIEPGDGGEVGFDLVNRIVVREQRWCSPGPPERCHDSSAIGLTSITFVDQPGTPDDGVILDADIELNAVDFALASCDGQPGGCTTTGDGPAADLANILAHELGHVLGLDHTCFPGPANEAPLDGDGNPVPPCAPPASLPPAAREATMFNFSDPEEVLKRTPEADDIAGFCRLYPLAMDPDVCMPAVPIGPVEGDPTTTEGSGGCCSTQRDASSAWLAVAVLALLRRRRRV